MEIDESKAGQTYAYATEFKGIDARKSVKSDYSAAGIRKSVEQSLERMKVSSIDTLRLHDCESEETWAQATAPGQNEKDGDAIGAMANLVKEGKVQKLSLGMNKADWILKFLQKYHGQNGVVFDSVMM